MSDDDDSWDLSIPWIIAALATGLFMGWQACRGFMWWQEEEAKSMKAFKKDIMDKRLKAQAAAKKKKEKETKKKEEKKDVGRKQESGERGQQGKGQRGGRRQQREDVADSGDSNPGNINMALDIDEYLSYTDVNSEKQFKEAASKAIKHMFSYFNVLYDENKKNLNKPDKDYVMIDINKSSISGLFDLIDMFGNDIRRVIISNENDIKNFIICRGKSGVWFSVIIYEETIILTIFKNSDAIKYCMGKEDKVIKLA